MWQERLENLRRSLEMTKSDVGILLGYDENTGGSRVSELFNGRREFPTHIQNTIFLLEFFIQLVGKDQVKKIFEEEIKTRRFTSSVRPTFDENREDSVMVKLLIEIWAFLKIFTDNISKPKEVGVKLNHTGVVRLTDFIRSALYNQIEDQDKALKRAFKYVFVPLTLYLTGKEDIIPNFTNAEIDDLKFRIEKKLYPIKPF